MTTRVQRLAAWIAGHGYAVAVVDLKGRPACVWAEPWPSFLGVQGWDSHLAFTHGEARRALGYGNWR